MKILIAVRKFFGKALGDLKVVRYTYLFIKSLFSKGPRETIKILLKKYRKNAIIRNSKMYFSMFPSEEVLVIQRNRAFKYKPKLSILVPLYNTSDIFLKDMMSSVLRQTYTNWELILVDASDISIKSKIYSDPRMKYVRLQNNNGIVENTNYAYRFATGDYIGLLDHDDMLNDQCLYKVVERINEGADFIYTDEITFKHDPKIDCFQPNLKSDFSPDTLRSYNYICHFCCFKKALLKENEALLNEDTEGSQDYDLILRLSERAMQIDHIAIPLYFWRSHELSVASDYSAKPYVIDAAKTALSNHLLRIKLDGIVIDGIIPTTYKINYRILNNPLVSVIIPNCDHVEDLDKCIDSLKKSSYSNYEILIIENNSVKAETFDFYKQIECTNIKVIKYEHDFNYSKINNFAVSYAKGEYLVLLNNDICVISVNWLEEMLMYAQRNDVGCVGAKLLYPDNTIQHAGVILGVGSVAGHSHKYMSKDDYGFMSRIQIVQNLSAVTAACLMVKKSDYIKVDGFDEEFAVAFNDVDFCLRIRQLGKYNLYTPFAELYHYESKSRGVENTPEKVTRFNEEIKLFEKRWGLWTEDPFYNTNLTLKNEQFDLKYHDD